MADVLIKTHNTCGKKAKCNTSENIGFKHRFRTVMSECLWPECFVSYAAQTSYSPKRNLGYHVSLTFSKI